MTIEEVSVLRPGGSLNELLTSLPFLKAISICVIGIIRK